MTEENGKNLNDVEEVLPKPLQGRVEAAAGEEETILPGALDQAPADDGQAAEWASAPVNVMTPVQAFFKGLGGKLLAAALLVAILVACKLICGSLLNGSDPRIGEIRPSDNEIVAPAETEWMEQHKLPHEQDQSLLENVPIQPPAPTKTEESESSDPTQPIAPTDSEERMAQNPTQPSETSKPDTPPAPSPTQPSQPSKPDTTSTPKPTQPTEPTEPHTPSGPKPTLPTDPTEPGPGAGGGEAPEPTVPAEPTDPSDPEPEVPEPTQPIDPILLDSGTCGPNLTWSFDEDTGTLSIEGSGEMYDYDIRNNNPSPWFDIRENITSVEFPDGLTTIGRLAFLNCEELTIVDIPIGVTRIGANAFEGCFELSHAHISSSVVSIESRAFHGTSLRAVMIPDGVRSIGSNAFMAGLLDIVYIPESVVSIGEEAFIGSPFLTIRGVPGSEAERYANENGIPFEAAP